MSPIRFTSPLPEVQLHLPDGRTLQGPRGAPLQDFLSQVQTSAPIVGAVYNGELRELTYAAQTEGQITPVTMAEADGARIYRRSLTFLLEAAFNTLFPEQTLAIDHSVASGGYYCQVGGAPLPADGLTRLEAEMRRLVALRLPFERREAPLQEALQYFEREGSYDKAGLLRYRQKTYVTLYALDGHLDYHHGYMTPHTGFLQWFAITPANGGFILHYPRRHSPTEIKPMEDFPKLLQAFRQYGGWLERLEIASVGALNQAVSSGRQQQIILVSEALHEQHIAAIATQIASQKETRLALIAGPSSSGKTTFSRRLAVQLLALGISPYALELDNYFLDREKTPQDENGTFDFETIEALDLPRLWKDLQALVRGEEVPLPRYNFKAGRQEEGEAVRLRPGQLILLEGIHGLNPRLIPPTLAGQSFKVYASALTQLNLDRHNRVSTTDTRLVRRIVRDARERGYNASQTLSRWESVRRGEKRHIFPFQENADVMFNSALVYELGMLRPLAEPLLRQVPHNTPEFIEAKRLLAFLEWFLPLDASLVPDNSILREFLGESILKNFTVWGQ